MAYPESREGGPVPIRDLLLSMPVWVYFLVAPVFMVLNLIIAGGLVGALKRRTPVIQQNPPANVKTRDVRRTLAVNYTLLSGFAGGTLYYLARGSNVSWTDISLTNTLLAVVLVLIGNDVLYYAYHRLMHTDYFWNRLHYLHHEAVSPGGLSDTFYEHPLDFFVGTLCATVPLLIVPINIGAAVLCLFLQTFFAVAYHSGHEIRVPAIFTARRHDDHHRYYRGNYAQNFALVDMLFGTVIQKKDGPIVPAEAPVGAGRS
jgi:sterol desaturase/sphingolipid hydroxylase (fatty acid hydroxylase superfamily)